MPAVSGERNKGGVNSAHIMSNQWSQVDNIQAKGAVS